MTTITKRKYLRAIIFLAILACLISIGIKQTDDRQISATTHKYAGGWGYEIMVDDQVFIHQENIPGYSNARGFSTEEQAKAAASLVIEKLSSSGLPTLSSEEITAIIANPKP